MWKWYKSRRTETVFFALEILGRDLNSTLMTEMPRRVYERAGGEQGAGTWGGSPWADPGTALAKAGGGIQVTLGGGDTHSREGRLLSCMRGCQLFPCGIQGAGRAGSREEEVPQLTVRSRSEG